MRHRPSAHPANQHPGWCTSAGKHRNSRAGPHEVDLHAVSLLYRKSMDWTLMGEDRKPLKILRLLVHASNYPCNLTCIAVGLPSSHCHQYKIRHHIAKQASLAKAAFHCACSSFSRQIPTWHRYQQLRLSNESGRYRFFRGHRLGYRG